VTTLAYVRGGTGSSADSRRVARVVVGFVVAVLALLLVVLMVGAAGKDRQDARLKQHGVPVAATVTRCLGLASGTGITVSGYTCWATFAVSGRHYTDVIGGTSQHYARGAIVAAVTDPSRPSVLSTTEGVAVARPWWRAFIPAAVVLALLLMIALPTLIRSSPAVQPRAF
jgi:hypothetical protein